jgi:2-phosphosulfolactate phosphatase
VRRLFDREHIHILCSGTEGKMGDDDILLAGMLVDRLQREGGMVYQQNAQAMTARETWLHSFALPQALGAEPLNPDLLATELRKSLGGHNLMSLGLDDDILAASWISRFDLVPRFDVKRISVTAEGMADE